MNNPLVSIIIPTFNRAHLIGETLDSVLVQTYTNWECIIVDDGSTDNTNDIVHSYEEKDHRFQYHKRPNTYKSGGNGARNYGFEMSKGEYINWFDSDDIMMPDFLKSKISVFLEDYFFVIGTGYYWYPEKFTKEKIDLFVKESLFQEYVMWKAKVLTPSVLFRKKFLLNKELFTDKISRGQETELFSRLFFELPQSNYQVINEPLFLYRQHEDTKTFKNQVYNREYKESQTYIGIQNFKRGIEIGNKEVINYFYKAILMLFFRALDNKHRTIVKMILKKFTLALFKISPILALQFFTAGIIFYILNKGSFRVERYLKSYKF